MPGERGGGQEMSSQQVFPEWLKVRLPGDGGQGPVSQVIRQHNLRTVCRSAACPNIGHCYGSGTATFLILGGVCTRACRFCAVPGGLPAAPDPEEPAQLTAAAKELGLRHVVITSVSRDDLPDGGAAHFAACIRRLHAELPELSVEVLVPDFQGCQAAAAQVLYERPEVFNHNIETVPRLYPTVRPAADYRCSLAVLRQAAGHGGMIKSGLMVGLGESEEEVIAVLHDLWAAGVTMLTIGQYLRPSASHMAVAKFVHPDQFANYAALAEQIGFTQVASGPLVRSSYQAAEFWTAAKTNAGRLQSCSKDY